MTEIELCGEMRVRIAGQEVAESLPGAQGRMLLAYLVLNRRRAVSREELIAALWPPDGAPASPSAGLSTVLARLNRAIGKGRIVGSSELWLELEDDAKVDVERAEELAAEAERALQRRDGRVAGAAAEAALRIVTRRFLAGIDADWIDDKRSELDETGARLLEVAAAAELELGGARLVEAERLARRLTQLHPLRESGYALLMQAQARRGNVAEALLTYDRLRVMLRDEVGTAPSTSVAELHRRLLEHGAVEAPSPSVNGADHAVELPERMRLGSRRAFVGREGELKDLRSVWSGVGAGRRRFAYVLGDPGIGKTRLAARFAEGVHGEGATVLYGRCDEETVVPYQPFVEALRHYLQHSRWTADESLRPELQALGRLVPEVRRFAARSGDSPSGDPETQRYWLFEAVSGLLSRWADTKPMLLVVDDLQWAERPTLLLLRHILRDPSDSALMVLATVRRGAEPADDLLRALLLEGDGDVRELVLSGLDQAATDAIVAARLEAPATDAFIRALRAKTDGNPLFIEEALQTLSESGALRDAAAASAELLAQMNVPKRVQELTVRRLGSTSERTVEALTVAAVVAHGGTEFDLQTLSAVLNEPPDQVLVAIEEALASELVVELPDRLDTFAFCHALVRDAIYARISRSRCVRLHLRVGEALEARAAKQDVPAAQLAHHFWTARGVVGAARSIGYAERAGSEAATAFAYEDAIAHFRRAVEACAATGPEREARRCELLLALGRVQWHAGEMTARDTFRDAAASAQSRRSAEQLARAALGFGDRYWEGEVREVRAYLTEALQMLSEDDSVLRVRVLARLGEILHFTADYDEGKARSLEAVEMARRLERDPAADEGERTARRSARLSALKGRHVALSDIAHLDDRVRLIEEARSVPGVRRELSGEVLLWRLFDLMELGDLATARQVHAELVALAAELGQPLFRHVASAWHGVFAWVDGDVDGLERQVQETEALGRRANNNDAPSTVTAQRYGLRRLQGRLADLEPALVSLGEGPIAPWPWRVGLALARLETGDLTDARQRYERFAEGGFRVARDYLWLSATVLLAEICASFDDRPRAAVLYDELAPYADRFVQVGIASWWGSVERYLGMLARTLGEAEAAERHLTAAIEHHEARGAPLLAAISRCEYAVLLGSRGDRERAAALGASVAEFAEARGLEALASRALGAGS